MNSFVKKEPFLRSQPVGHSIAMTIAIVGLVLLLFGNSDYLKGDSIFHADLPSFLSNLGFTLFVLSASQWLIDHRFRNAFFLDIRNELLSSSSLVEAGVVSAFDAARRIDYSSLIRDSKEIIIGVTYSDRFLKDYFGEILNSKDLKIVVIHYDSDDKLLTDAVAKSTDQSVEAIKSHIASLESMVRDINKKGRKSGISVSTIKSPSIPKYGFVVFDRREYFLIFSTFSKRRAEVPALQVNKNGYFARHVDECLASLGVDNA